MAEIVEELVENPDIVDADIEEPLESDFSEYLQDAYGDVEICGLLYNSAEALKEVDPTAYSTAFADWESENIKYLCPVCGDDHSNEDSAKFCCTEETVTEYVVRSCNGLVVGSFYSEEDAESALEEQQAAEDEDDNDI